MPRLETGEPLPTYLSSFTALFSLRPNEPRKHVVRQLMLRSVRLHFGRSRSRAEDEEQLDSFQGGTLPLRVRPAFVVLNVLALIVLAILGCVLDRKGTASREVKADVLPSMRTYTASTRAQAISCRSTIKFCTLCASSSCVASWRSRCTLLQALMLTCSSSHRLPDCSTLSGTWTNRHGGYGSGGTCH